MTGRCSTRLSFGNGGIPLAWGSLSIFTANSPYEMKKVLLWLAWIAIFCSAHLRAQEGGVRPMHDTIGFASAAYKMDSVWKRIAIPCTMTESDGRAARVVVCPHDDYAYAGHVYPSGLSSIKAPIVILFGVAHRLPLRNRLIFDNFVSWHSAYGPVKVSPVRRDIMAALPEDLFVVSDSIHAREHSLAALVPFLQRYNPLVEIVPILVSAMPFDSMEMVAGRLAVAIGRVMAQKDLTWGREYAFAISNDAVHYGDADWGGKNYAPFGSDTAGYLQAIRYEHKLITGYLVPHTSREKLKGFHSQLVDQNLQYKWTWCGRNSLPFGLLTALALQKSLKTPVLHGTLKDYSTSISRLPLPVEDLGMGRTAPASLRHWVGYASIVYE